MANYRHELYFVHLKLVECNPELAKSGQRETARAASPD